MVGVPLDRLAYFNSSPKEMDDADETDVAMTKKSRGQAVSSKNSWTTSLSRAPLRINPQVTCHNHKPPKTPLLWKKE